MRAFILLLCWFVGTNSVPLFAQTAAPVEKRTSINHLIMEEIKRMPEGGGYATNARAFEKLGQAIRNESGRLSIDATDAKPSFCSSATYLVFISVLDRLNRAGQLALSDADRFALMIKSQPDGVGIWGRWNANGPGTARLFHELGIGKNFSSFEEAQTGDFLKIFWNEHIGSQERGHSVIYLGRSKAADGSETVKFWSSNQGAGYGEKTVPRSKIKRALFSRLTIPGGSIRFDALPKKDDYLAAMLKRPSTAEEMLRLVGGRP